MESTPLKLREEASIGLGISGAKPVHELGVTSRGRFILQKRSNTALASPD
jgi:hypothetical protein